MVARPAASGAAAAAEPSFDDDLSFNTLTFEDDDDEGSSKGSSDEGPLGSPHDDSGYPERSPHPNRARGKRGKPQLGEVSSRSPIVVLRITLVLGMTLPLRTLPPTPCPQPFGPLIAWQPPRVTWATLCDVIPRSSVQPSWASESPRGCANCCEDRVEMLPSSAARSHRCQLRVPRDSWCPSLTMRPPQIWRSSGVTVRGRARARGRMHAYC